MEQQNDKIKEEVPAYRGVVETVICIGRAQVTAQLRASRGFSFLGYFLKPGKISVAEATVNNMKERIARLYEQGADLVSIWQYVVRWSKWVLDVLGDIEPELITRIQ